jgi:Caspase domain
MAKRALLVGIDVYPDPRNNLNSCVNDTLAFKELLHNTYQFAPEAITLLQNKDATLENVKAGMETLFTGVTNDDELVYFQSSHGYRYPDGNTMVEVLCLYDGFLEDTEFVRRTQDIPPGVLTVVLDACHSGGMNKLFFPTGEGQEVQLARVKVWQPTDKEAEHLAQTYAQVTQFKFFGRAATGDTGAVAKNFVVSPVGVPQVKDLDEGKLELNGVLFAACAADQTAAAGSLQTKNLSAFTYGLVSQIDTAVSLARLCERVGDRLAELNMSQTPQAEVPLDQQGLLTETFITMQPGAEPAPGPTGNDSFVPRGPGGGFDPDAWLRRQLGVGV